MGEQPFGPVRQIDAPALRDAIVAAGGPPVELVARLAGGAVGAWVIRWPDGHEGVLTWRPSREPPHPGGDVQALMDIARSVGVPVPRYEAVIDVGALGLAVLQERAPGRLPEGATPGLVENLLRLAEARRGALAGTRFAGWPMPLFLTRSGPGFCLHEPLRAYSARSSALLDAIVTAAPPGDQLVGDDLVHLDYHLGNVLVDEEDPDTVTAVLDWDGARAGTLALDLAILAFDLTQTGPGPLQQRVERHLLATTDPGVIPALWAHASLRLVDWSIRHHPPEVTDHWLAVAEEHLYP